MFHKKDSSIYHETVNQINSYSKTFLMAACEQGSTSLIDFLIESGANIDMSDKGKNTALHYAVESHKKAAVALLVSRGANVNKQDSGGETPLHLAVRKNYEDVVKVLLNSKENNNLQVNQQRRDGWIALHFPCCCGRKDVVELPLQQNGIDVNAVENKGWTALHVACRYGSKDVVELLLKHKDTDVNAETKQGHTPLHLASFHGRKDVVDFLLQQNGIDVNKVNLEGDTPLHLAVQKCMLCEENEASMELQPCAHTVLCEDCSKIQLNRCPKCKTCIESKRRVESLNLEENRSHSTSKKVAVKQQQVETPKLEEKCLQDVAKLLGVDWQQVGRNLGIRNVDLGIIRYDYPHNTKEQSFQMLHTWYTSCDPEMRTFKTLRKALVEAECFEALQCLPSEEK
ncbi:serine/threonine-protein phosphatase 6 regulatory ankyrin repeat subunit B-like isoform X12 [Octopus vulgaris]|uniref:Serine/threonine-protein phosphatase 6 regulatory ankyrin repeat subunit B-like isoform X12 n=1 Tax=Octopus vulgaris TaxID=6645 RepID=A0AA36C206_OCTVU|nr:serine/threonine-protein phosphatase 6 regulatory ankyrin repeat subunit B-like isoform X12 [Octopus vulgaris]